MSRPLISFSVVSHGQQALVEQLLSDLLPLRKQHDIELIVTANIPEQRRWLQLGEPDVRTSLIENSRPLGFGANHNQAFAMSTGQYFCIVNPDIRMPTDPFPPLIERADAQGGTLVSPVVLGPEGAVEDHARAFPTFGRLIRRRLGLGDQALRSSASAAEGAIAVDWLAGMFILLPRELFASLGGFDERFFMYCEDVDLSARAWSSGHSVEVCPTSRVIHYARRASGRNWRHTCWHLSSMARLWYKWRAGFPDRAAVRH